MIVLGCFVLSDQDNGARLVGARHPSLSPDGTRIAFSYMGDIWMVGVKGGHAARLTDHVAYDGEPVWSPEGKRIAFSSNRHGNFDVYIMDAEGGVPTRLTYHSGDDFATDFTPDGEWVVFRSGRPPSPGIFKIPAAGGNPAPLLSSLWRRPYHARISNDGRYFLFSLGMENGSWWRRGYRGTNSAKLWIKGIGDSEARKIFSENSNAFWPSWAADGDSVYFVSDREAGIKNIWHVGRDGSGLRTVTEFKDADITWMSKARNVPLAVYERLFCLWITDLKTGESYPVEIKAPTEMKDNRFAVVENAQVSEYKLSPDGKKIAAVVRGDVFVLSAEGGYARNITQSSWRERDVDWDKESRRIVYVADVEVQPDLYIRSALGDQKPFRLTESPGDKLLPRFSPDGRWIAFYRGNRELRLIKPDGTENRLLFEADFGGRFADDFAWSPDSRYLAVVVKENSNDNIFAVDIASGNRTPLTNTAYDESFAQWSPDGKFLLFSSNRFGHSFPEFSGKWDLYQVCLEPKEPEFKEEKFEKLFQEPDKEKKKEKPEEKEVTIELKIEDLDVQTERVVETPGNERMFLLPPKDTNSLYFVSDMDGRSHLWKTSLEEDKRGRYEPFSPQVASPRSLQSDSEGKYLYYLSRGRLGRIEMRSQKNTSISFEAKIKIDKVKEYEQMLGELYYTLEYYYYDAQHHQVDWKNTYEKFRPVLQQVREDRDFYDYANMMIGYLNSSHTGIRGPRETETTDPSAHTGAVWDFKEGKVVLNRIIKNGPLFRHRDRVSSGDILAEVDGQAVSAGSNLWRSFNGKLGKRLKLKFAPNREPGEIEVDLEPISSYAESRLLLDEWIEDRRDKVKQATGGRAAYIYMRAMGGRDLERFLTELERDAVPREGLILDLRFNFGGNVHDRVLQALTKPVYAKWRMRGLSETPQSSFGFADKPVVLLINEVTLSDGEMTANGFKTLERGPLVGNTTYGWLIFTTSVRLLNGGSFRLPWWGCYTLDGKDLETSGGVTPDVHIINELNHELRGEDPQLNKAIEILMSKMNEVKR